MRKNVRRGKRKTKKKKKENDKRERKKDYDRRCIRWVMKEVGRAEGR